jgi:pimeloyl-ACP methyl ester carboxylesterase
MALKADSTAYQAYGKMIPQCVEAMLETPVFDYLSDLKPQTLVIYGTGDLLIPNKILHPNLRTEAVAKSAIAKIPQAELVLLPDCGHFVQWECAPATAQAIQSFLK